MRHLLIAAMIAIAFGMAAAPAQATDLVGASASGSCHYDGAGGSDSTSVGVDDEAVPPHSVEYPDEATVQDGAEACANAAANGETPGGGSHLAASASAVDGAVQADASTVPATDAVTGVDKTQTTSAQASGACNPFGDGAEDSAGVSVSSDGSSSVDQPSPSAIQAAFSACAASGGPGPGSYLAGSVSVADGVVSAGFNTVPISNQLP